MSESEPRSTTSRHGIREEQPGGRKFGFALFDDERNPGACWISVEGSEPQRKEGPNELATNTLWWTNMAYEPFFRQTEMWRNPWLRHAEYLPVTPKNLLMEWGCEPTAPPNYVANMCSSLFARIMKMAFTLALECDEKVRMSNLFIGNTLSSDLQRLMPNADFPKGEAASIMKQGQAWAAFTRTGVRGIKGGRTVRLMCPRVPYAVDLLTTPVPCGKFEFKSRRALREISNDRVKWIRETERPVMVEISVESMESEVAPIYGFGNSTDRDKKIPRSWVPHPEFLAMSSFSDLDVMNVWIGAGYEALNLKLPEPIKKFLENKYTESSWSAGVVAEAICRSAQLGPGKTKAGAGEDRPQTSWRGAWLKGADKVNMFRAAMRLTDMGYSAMAYGFGWVNILVSEDQIKDLVNDGLTLGLIPRLQDVPEGMFELDSAINWGGDRKSQVYAQLVMSREKQLLWNLDRLPLFERAQREAMLKRIVEAHQKKRLS
jgi:hypothetical protein